MRAATDGWDKETDEWHEFEGHRATFISNAKIANRTTPALVDPAGLPTNPYLRGTRPHYPDAANQPCFEACSSRPLPRPVRTLQTKASAACDPGYMQPKWKMSSEGAHIRSQ